ncbi:LysE family translocator [Promicromonospora sp. NPDC052451]|uniref:LysE family translocator n=1 Tax=Promicromonospora sp. NPDC052451 TaxID=3364407 RepID=UPI0037CA6C3E
MPPNYPVACARPTPHDDGRRRRPLPVPGTADEERSAWRSFAVGATTNLLNPKVGVFYLATIPQFLPDDVPHLLMGLLLAVEHDIIGMAWLALLIHAAGLARRWLSGRAIARATDRVTGTVLLALGGRIGWNALTGQARAL